MARVKKQKGEKLDDEHIERVIAHLEGGGTKKDAYDILNIKANPGRLTRILEEYEERKVRDARIRKEKRGKPADNFEIQAIIEASLNGDSLSSVADDLYRPITFVKGVIDKVGIPQKLSGNYWDNRFKSSIPDQCVSESFKINEIVWSNKYNGLAIVRGREQNGYQIYVIEVIEERPDFAIGGRVYEGHGGFFAFQRTEELGSLKHLKEYGIDIYRPYRSSFPKWLG